MGARAWLDAEQIGQLSASFVTAIRVVLATTWFCPCTLIQPRVSQHKCFCSARHNSEALIHCMVHTGVSRLRSRICADFKCLLSGSFELAHAVDVACGSGIISHFLIL